MYVMLKFLSNEAHGDHFVLTLSCSHWVTIRDDVIRHVMPYNNFSQEYHANHTWQSDFNPTRHKHLFMGMPDIKRDQLKQEEKHLSFNSHASTHKVGPTIMSWICTSFNLVFNRHRLANLWAPKAHFQL